MKSTCKEGTREEEEEALHTAEIISLFTLTGSHRMIVGLLVGLSCKKDSTSDIVY